MICRGRVNNVINVSDKITQVIIKMKRGNIFLPVSFIAYGEIKILINQIKLEKGDLVKIDYYIKSKMMDNGSYVTNVIIDKIKITDKKSPQLRVDMETGELY